MSSASDYRKLFKRLRNAGWEVSKTNNGHYQVISPTGVTLVTPGSASDHRSFTNFLSDLRRYAGWDDKQERIRKGKKKG